ncbi:LysR family transcriptional regulator [Priestia megaterium]|uniref:LysR family transcriptional regulator n=1 Tax=Priestia TaxID=2800373 RepID=UPI000D50E471|nr:LysR family transcriptional regulator [Priestia megaterium]MBU8851894.1 LysR family transcriptional regulator [Bacillus sp. FJAT-26377]PVC72140.1 LysR family transcriptional regulator [Priestia megaterium]
MDIKDLLVFTTVAEEKNISKAAKTLSYVQSNVTMRIQQLEAELGTQLFQRSGKGVTLTSSGELLHRYAEEILRLTNEATITVQSSAHTPIGPLKIGATESTAALRLPPLLSTYCTAYPDVDFILETHTTDVLIQLVLERKLEGAFVAGSCDNPDVNTLFIQDEELVLVSRHPLPSLYSLNDMNLLAFSSGCAYRHTLEMLLTKEGVFPKRILEFGTIEAIIGCVKAGMGVAVMMKSIVSNHNHSLTLTPLPQPYSKVSTFFITRKDAFISAALREFSSLLTEQLCITKP